MPFDRKICTLSPYSSCDRTIALFSLLRVCLFKTWRYETITQLTMSSTIVTVGFVDHTKVSRINPGQLSTVASKNLYGVLPLWGPHVMFVWKNVQDGYKHATAVRSKATRKFFSASEKDLKHIINN